MTPRSSAIPHAGDLLLSGSNAGEFFILPISFYEGLQHLRKVPK